jgi:hypothetical protein
MNEGFDSPTRYNQKEREAPILHWGLFVFENQRDVIENYFWFAGDNRIKMCTTFLRLKKSFDFYLRIIFWNSKMAAIFWNSIFKNIFSLISFVIQTSGPGASIKKRLRRKKWSPTTAFVLKVNYNHAYAGLFH